jgi:hypothetical protein
MGGWLLLLDLPDAIFYLILSFVERPTSIAPFLTRSIGVLSKEIHHHIENNRNALWEIILSCDYKNDGSTNAILNAKCGSKRPRKRREEQGQDSVYINQRRISDRLRRSSAREDVMFCHKKLCDRTEFVIHQLSEMSNDKRNPLTLTKLRTIFRREGPILRVNLRATTGGTLLVEILRSRFVRTDAVILRCVKELIEVHGADPNLPAADSGNLATSTSTGQRCSWIPPLVIAAGRGLHSVVRYLVQAGACIHATGTARFRLISRHYKTFKGTFLTPLEFSKALMAEELHYGATEDTVKGLKECIRILNAATKKVS